MSLPRWGQELIPQPRQGSSAEQSINLNAAVTEISYNWCVGKTELELFEETDGEKDRRPSGQLMKCWCIAWEWAEASQTRVTSGRTESSRRAVDRTEENLWLRNTGYGNDQRQNWKEFSLGKEEINYVKSDNSLTHHIKNTFSMSISKLCTVYNSGNTCTCNNFHLYANSEKEDRN